MTKTKLILLVSFLLVFAAGVSLGVLVGGAIHPPRHRSWLAGELNLTADQRDQMRKIWSDTAGSAFRQQRERRAALAQERDQAVLSLLSQQQRSQYDAIQQEYSRKLDELSQERKRAFEEAVERTKQILTPEQAVKYDEMIRRQREQGVEAGPPGLRGPRRRHSPPASESTTNETSAPRGGEQ